MGVEGKAKGKTSNRNLCGVASLTKTRIRRKDACPKYLSNGPSFKVKVILEMIELK